MNPIRQALQHGLKKLSFVLEHKVSRQFDVLYTKGWTERSSSDFHIVNAAHMNQQFSDHIRKQQALTFNQKG